MLDINIIEKSYSNEVVLKGLNIYIDKPGIYGIIGKNGQGKTTLFKCVLGLESYKGKSVLNKEKISLQNTAFCPAEPLIYEELTADEFCEFYCNLLDIPLYQKDKELFHLPKDKLIKNFSTGMKKKVYINAVFQKKFILYFLDEPFNGLDMESNYILIEDLKRKAKDSIIIVSSHLIEILYKNCNRIFLLKNKGVIEYNPEDFCNIETDFNNI